MTQDEKQLLLKDLCGRLLYRVIIHLVKSNEDEELYCLNILQEGLYTKSLEHNYVTTLSPIEGIKPYLRSMSSMTKEERKGYDSKRKHICDDYNRYCFDTIESIDWLKSLKDRVQPKVEWSEEDETKRNALIGLVEEIKSRPLKRLEDWDGYISWLKSLRPQKQWKPTEDQMEQLGWIAEQNKNNMIGKGLMNLYNDLKKLRNE